MATTMAYDFGLGSPLGSSVELNACFSSLPNPTCLATPSNSTLSHRRLRTALLSSASSSSSSSSSSPAHAHSNSPSSSCISSCVGPHLTQQFRRGPGSSNIAGPTVEVGLAPSVSQSMPTRHILPIETRLQLAPAHSRSLVISRIQTPQPRTVDEPISPDTQVKAGQLIVDSSTCDSPSANLGASKVSNNPSDIDIASLADSPSYHPPWLPNGATPGCQLSSSAASTGILTCISSSARCALPVKKRKLDWSHLVASEPVAPASSRISTSGNDGTEALQGLTFGQISYSSSLLVSEPFSSRNQLPFSCQRPHQHHHLAHHERQQMQQDTHAHCQVTRRLLNSAGCSSSTSTILASPLPNPSTNLSSRSPPPFAAQASEASLSSSNSAPVSPARDAPSPTPCNTTSRISPFQIHQLSSQNPNSSFSWLGTASTRLKPTSTQPLSVSHSPSDHKTVTHLEHLIPTSGSSIQFHRSASPDQQSTERLRVHTSETREGSSALGVDIGLLYNVMNRDQREIYQESITKNGEFIGLSGIDELRASDDYSCSNSTSSNLITVAKSEGVYAECLVPHQRTEPISSPVELHTKTDRRQHYASPTIAYPRVRSAESIVGHASSTESNSGDRVQEDATLTRASVFALTRALTDTQNNKNSMNSERRSLETSLLDGQFEDGALRRSLLSTIPSPLMPSGFRLQPSRLHSSLRAHHQQEMSQLHLLEPKVGYQSSRLSPQINDLGNSSQLSESACNGHTPSHDPPDLSGDILARLTTGDAKYSPRVRTSPSRLSSITRRFCHPKESDKPVIPLDQQRYQLVATSDNKGCQESRS
ncbi:unnamed protein product [Protopolystoma xenopodis]|uniref:Uncharacterized protein n=1 Tax=Protopolystoma xenopodis TaxID=117903 RepID=A0A3S5CJ35_9PLAT|nr:unnamed protein product [Protopolystoma xenopodis]